MNYLRKFEIRKFWTMLSDWRIFYAKLQFVWCHFWIWIGVQSLRWRISRMKSQKCVSRLPKIKIFTQKLFITVEKPLNLILNTEKPQVGLRKSLNRVLNAKNCCRPPSKSQNSLNVCNEAQKQLNGQPSLPKNLQNRFTILSHN